MRVVTYARVSTLAQESEGESLDNQERAFQTYISRSGADCLANYHEAASAKSVAGRAEFSRMIADLPVTKPDAIVVDTLDRFTRNLREGLNLLEQLRGHGVGLLPLDWQRNDPIDLDDDSDWAQVVEEFQAAERERRRIRKRMKRSFEGRRERGATTTNNPPFGLRKRGDRLEPDPETAWIVLEAENRFLQGEAIADIVRWARSVHPRSWGSNATVNGMLANPAFLVAGARTPERQDEIDGALELRRGRFGQQRRHENEFTGVFVCGRCSDRGDPRIMPGSWRKHGKSGNVYEPYLFCKGGHPLDERHVFTVTQHLVERQWWLYIDTLALDEALIRRWVEAEDQPTPQRARSLQHRLADLDQQQAALKARRDRALDLLSDRSAGVKRQARKALEECDRDDMALALARQAVVDELTRAPHRNRDAAALREKIGQYRAIYAGAPIRTRNELNRALCAAIGSRPRIYRNGRHDDPMVYWPEIEALRRRPLPARR